MTDARRLATLARIERRVRWLAAWMVHEANARRPGDGTKVGGHQASSASVATLLTGLYFDALRPGDVVAVKAHAAPAFYAIRYLRGDLDADAVQGLRAFGGLQAYPSRRKNPGLVDLTTGSMGLGAVAATLGALTARYLADHGAETVTPERVVVLTGDAELDEGNVWEALGEEVVRRLGNVLWIVDVNRQSLDRILPDTRVPQLVDMFRAAGWRVRELRWGRRLERLFARRGGARLRERLLALGNRGYQRLLRLSGGEARKVLVATADGVDRALDRLLGDVPDDALPALVGDLGGHDLARVLDAYAEAADERDRPTAIFAHTIKGFGLPFAGDPLNHGLVTTAAQIETLREALGIPAGEEWARFAPDSDEDRLVRGLPPLFHPPARVSAPPPVPADLGETYPVEASTQEAFGRVLGALARHPVADRIVTASADVAVTTHLAGWINRKGVWFPEARPDPFADGGRAMTWKESPAGQHVELGIAEHDLFLLLGALGLSAELSGVTLLPIGTLYDAFVPRALDALGHALYAGSRFVVVATPSGVSLAPEGGAHQSVVTPPIGVALPGIAYFEPAFAREVEWILLESLRAIAERRGESLYLRLSTRPVAQALGPPPSAAYRDAVLRGGYRLVDARAEPGWAADRAVLVFAMGAVVPEAVVAAARLRGRGVLASVVVVTSPDALSRELRRPRPWLETLVSADEEDVPIVSVLDGHSSALAFLGGALGVPQLALGVDAFGQSGARPDLYRHYGIDAAAIVDAARTLLGS